MVKQRAEIARKVAGSSSDLTLSRLRMPWPRRRGVATLAPASMCEHAGQWPQAMRYTSGKTRWR